MFVLVDASGRETETFSPSKSAEPDLESVLASPRPGVRVRAASGLLHHVWEDEDGLLWTYSLAPDPDWRPGIPMSLRATCA